MITIIAKALLHSQLVDDGPDEGPKYVFEVPVEGTTTIIGDLNRHTFSPYTQINEEVLVFDTLEHFTMYCSVKGNPDMTRVWLEDPNGHHVTPIYTDAHSLKYAMRAVGVYPDHKILLRTTTPPTSKNKEVI